MAATAKGIVYPTSGDNIAPLETHFASLAETADDAIGVLETAVETVQDNIDALELAVGKVPQTGKFTFTGPTSTTTPVNVTVTLPGGYFTVAPTVVTTVSGGSGASAYFAVTHSITTSQFQARIWRTTGTTAESLTLQWIAK